MSKHPVGATWEIKNNGQLGVIELSNRYKSHGRIIEYWRWSRYYIERDGSVSYDTGDTGGSYRFCRWEICMDGRAKRTK